MDKVLVGKKVLILYTAHTMGHARIAENIGYWLGESGAEVALREVLKSNPSKLIKRFLSFHIWVNTYVPRVWKFLYMWGFWIFMMPWRLLVANFQKSEIEKIVETLKPDIIITTQTSPSAVVSVLKRQKKFAGLWGIAFSDYHFHRAWVYPRADFYLANIEEQEMELTRLGVSKDNIFRMGLALPPLPNIDRDVIRQKLGIARTQKVVLVGSGSLGVRMPEELMKALDELVGRGKSEGLDITVVVACGRNAGLCEELVRARELKPWLIPIGFYEPMYELYAVSDIFLSKPGGLTIAESIRQTLPVFITHYLPGQEELNIEYLEKHKAVVSLYKLEFHKWIEPLLTELKQGLIRQSIGVYAGLEGIVSPNNIGSLGHFVASSFINDSRN